MVVASNKVRCSESNERDAFDLRSISVYILLSNGLRCLAISSSLMRLLMRMPAMLLGLDKTIGASIPRSAKSELIPVAYPFMVPLWY